MRWVKANGSNYKLDTCRIAACGASAGGHLAALIGTSANVEGLEDRHMGNSEETTDVQAVVEWYGPIDFLTMDAQFEANNREGEKHNTPDSFESQLLGRPIVDIPDQVKAANPEVYITVDTPPFLIHHGTGDLVIPVEQSLHFARQLISVVGPDKVQCRLIEGAGHGDPRFYEPENVAGVFNFLDNYLK